MSDRTPYRLQLILAVLIASVTLNLRASPEAVDQQPQVTGTGVVAGQVVDATTKRPVASAVVTLTSGPAAPASGGAPVPGAPPTPVTRRGVAVANAEGRFVFRDVPAGTYALTTTRNDYAGGATGRMRPGGPNGTFTLADGARMTDIVIPMWRLAAISGTVRDDRGEPAVGISVWAMRRTITNGRLELTFTGGTVEATDDRGYYRLSRLQPGSYVVGVRTNVQSAAVTTVDAYRAAVMAGTSAAMTRDWIETGALRISPEGGLVVDGWQAGVSIGMPQPLPGPKGTLLIHPTTFHGGTHSAAEATVLTLAAGDDRAGVDLTLALVLGVRVAGVLNGPNGPAANHGIQLVPAATTEPAFETPSAYATTDAAGRFVLLGVTPGTYTIRARRAALPGPMARPVPPAAGAPPIATVETTSPSGPPAVSLFAEVPVTVGASHVDGLSISLQPGARLSGRVVFDSAMQPPAAQIQRVVLSLRPMTGAVPGGEARVDAAGAFQTSGYPPGRYLVIVGAPAPWTLASARVGSVDAAGQAFTLGTSDVTDVVLTFTDKAIELTGTVRPAESGGDASSTVVAFPADVRAWMASGMSARRLATAAVSASGAYQLRIPLPGDYLVVAVPPDVAPDVDEAFAKRFAAAAVRVSFAAGESKVQALTVGRPR